MDKPKNAGDYWTGSFGASLLCTTDMNYEIQLTSVDWETADPKPVGVVPALRVYQGESDGPSPFVGLLGKPWEDEELSTDATTFVHDLTGYHIDQPCEELDGGAKNDFTELILVMEAGPEGADITRFGINYTAKGRPYRLKIENRSIMCGTAISQRPEDDPGYSDC
ncbi:hypothetical protein [Zhihengliuella halotolerans]|uniref:Uncharacterized protein n=1 Tax=Zhihengliuella halotolerans TaxID=370736 RepID=A0A4Q8AEI8_9MICC|nr:hypothetical protein [Zhihengliuella halotolerans]RZU61989.1 hypothetical protein EV380_1574 [Zhihengliuella halotolerans]